jgi:hypothetical protein
MSRLDAHELILRYEALKSERENLDGQLELLTRFVMPGKGRFFQEGLDQEESLDWRHRELFDGTANNALILLASSIHGALTSPSSTWFELAFRDDELSDDKEASAWLEDCAERMRASLNDSNFNVEVNEFYQDGGGYGTAVMVHGEKEEGLNWRGHRFKTEMMRQCYIEEDSDGKATGLFIKRTYTAMQLELKFGKEALPESMRKLLDNPANTAIDKTHDVIQCIYLDPDLKDADVGQVLPVKSRPYAGQWLLVEGRHMLGDEQGFYEFPAYVLRWQRTAGSKYGNSPGIVALGDILTLQESVEAVRTATEKTVDPPMKHTRRGIIGDVELEGGGLTAVRDMEHLQPLMPPGSYRVDAGWADIQDLRQRIERYFFVDQLQLKESPTMTATEVQIRYEMMQRVLGPTLGRIISDFLDPLVERTFWMMYRKGGLAEMPESVATAGMADLDIEYVGPLAKAQKVSAVEAVNRWMQSLAALAEFFPEMMDMPDTDEIARYTAQTLGVPAKLVRSQAQIEAKREERARQQQQAQAIEMAQGAAKAAKDMGQSGLMEGGGAPPTEEGADVGSPPPPMQ